MADKDFSEALADAIDDGTDELEDHARKRAIRGSDSLLMFLLAGRRPEKFRRTATPEGKLEIEIKGGLPPAPVEPPAPAEPTDKK